MTNPIYPGVGVCCFVLNKEGKLLLGQRVQIEGFGNGCWQLPGGKIDWMETATEGVIRETKEETGLQIRFPEFLGYSNDFFPKANKHYVTLYFATSEFSGIAEVQEANKCSKWDWFEWDTLPQNIFCDWKHLLPQVKHFAKKNLNTKSS